MIDVVIALIEKDGKICIGERQKDPFKGFLECPGGKVEIGETLIEGLRRELKEEGDAEIETAFYMTHYDVVNQHGTYRLHWYKVSLKNAFKPIIYHEIHWVTIDEIAQLNWIPHNIPYIPMMQKALSAPIVNLELNLDEATLETIMFHLKDETKLIKNIHLHCGGYPLNDHLAYFLQHYSIRCIVGED